jgi:hypothetical protein
MITFSLGLHGNIVLSFVEVLIKENIMATQNFKLGEICKGGYSR